MKSNKQRRAEIMAKRQLRAEAKQGARFPRAPDVRWAAPGDGLPVHPWQVALNNSFGVPRLVYSDYTFNCRDCGSAEIWTASRQKWWYEVAGGHPWSRAIRCARCRELERERVKQAREMAEAGLARKRAILEKARFG